MKRLLVFSMALLFLGTAVAADKVVQSSAKSMPGWIGGMEEGYFIVSAEGETLDDAQEKAMTRVREQIISAIATKVHSETSITIHEINENGNIDSHNEMSRELSVQAADIPYLANVSPSHAEGYYWSKVQRADKSTYYVYHIKYPFSNSKLRLLIDDYEKQQKALDAELQKLADVNMADYDDLSDMMMQFENLKKFESGLGHNDGRRSICRSIRQSYEKMLSTNLRMEVVSSDRKATTIALMYGTKKLKNNKMPKVKSNCLTAIQMHGKGDVVVISYDYDTGCYDEDQNWLDISLAVSGKKLSTRCYIK